MRPLSLISLLLCVLAVPCAPQQTPAGELVLRTTTRLVTLNVVVRDKSGRAVPGLTAQDFTVLDEGKPQDVRLFQEERRAEPSLQAAAIATRMDLPADLPPNTFTNFRSDTAVPRSASVILLDGLNTPVVDQRYTRLKILEFLGQLQPDDHIGLYALGSQLRVLHDFTTDARSLLKALGRYAGELNDGGKTIVDVSIFMNDQKLQAALEGGREMEILTDQIAADQNTALLAMEVRVRRTMAALEAIAQRLAIAPGRKNLIWVSAAFPTVVATDIRMATGSPATFAADADRAVRALTEAGVAIYPIDARGVMVDLAYQASTTYNQRNMARLLNNTRGRGRRDQNRFPLSSPDPMVHAGRDEKTAHHDVMQELALRTGGRAFINTNDVAIALRDALDEGAASYTLGYYPSQYDESGKFRRLQVKAKCPGCAVRHREGYFGAERPGADRAAARETLSALVAAPFDVAGIPIAVQAAAMGERLRVAVRLDPASITLREARGRWLGRLDVVMIFLDEAGESKGGGEEALPLDLSAADREAAMASGFNYRQSLPRVAGASRLVVAVRDVPTGRVGTVRIELKDLPTE
jgi:VWFA-related protein